ncbi:hypothetical protein PENSPDRAFT_695600 [Peniophora sp. CONT]|nr:hypothetical protein PENSPDRAFT_695600 [Peniophora sp. CONT]
MPLLLTRRIAVFFGGGERLSFLYAELPGYQQSLLRGRSSQRDALRLLFRRYITRWPEDAQRALRSSRVWLDQPTALQVAVLTSYIQSWLYAHRHYRTVPGQ